MAMRNNSTKPTSSKSSLTFHTFPPFYACYLLKSVKTPRSTMTYIGSTPHPPRRIRQHNGEIAQGAWKTARNRPWVMNMIVHGFPSKLAALQFEWAWQHPNLSRHLRGETVAKGRTLKGNIAVAKSMLTTHPYTTWPLHVKLFTPEAVKGWTQACKDTSPLPPGMIVSIELEGVDGKGESTGSGRQGPIDVMDKAFSSDHLAKHAAALLTRNPYACTVCGSDLDIHTADPLSLALCPSSNCTAYTHLTCLAPFFLASSSAEASLIPRGGNCIECRNYILWGDIIRGCYRRRTGAQGTAIEQSVIVEDAERDEADSALMFEEAVAKIPSPKRKTPVPKKTAQRGSTTLLHEEGEFFDLDAISSSDFSSSSRGAKGATVSSPRPRGRPKGSQNKLEGIDAGRIEVLHDASEKVISRKKRQPEGESEHPDLHSASSPDSLLSSPSVGKETPLSLRRSAGSKNKPRKADAENVRRIYDIDEFSPAEIDGNSLSRRGKSKSRQGPSTRLEDALAAMRIQDVSPPLFSERKTSSSRGNQRPGRRGEYTGVIEISD